jgi:hypothetical protein
MLNKSAYLRDVMIKSVLRGSAFIPPNTNEFYVALFQSVAVDEFGPFMECDTIAFPGYQRTNVLFADTAVIGAVQNSIDVLIGPATSFWNNIYGIGIYDNETAGNLLYWGNFAAPIDVPSGRTLSMSVGDLIIKET